MILMSDELNDETKKRIDDLIASHKVFLFMKGNTMFPQCGFSARVVHALKQLDIEFETFNVLEDEDIRQGIKTYSNWPTIPQLYVNKEFIGGCDIVEQLAESGELKKKIDDS